MINNASLNDMLPQRTALTPDSELEDLVAQYISEMPSRVERLQHALAAGEWEHLKRIVHQLKGSAASYGFPAISVQAECVEQLLVQGTSGDHFREAVSELIVLCQLRQDPSDCTC
jgi:HPt (histidine-containing phosphotransfer) domain-containing protein